jgi:hypothetical protein
MFTGWIYNHLKPHAAALKVAHPLMQRAIALTSIKASNVVRDTFKKRARQRPGGGAEFFSNAADSWRSHQRCSSVEQTPLSGPRGESPRIRSV